MQFITVRNQDNNTAPPIKANYCSSFWCKFRGLMLRKHLNTTEGLLLVEKKDSRLNASIHMLFMRIKICVVWINNRQEVVDVCIADPWRLSYTPASPARYILETHPERINDFHIGDSIRFEHV